MRGKIIIMTLCALACSIWTSAQQYWDGARPNHLLSLGVRAGVNFSKQNNGGDGADTDFRTGFHAGLEADLNLVRSLSVNSGVYLTQKGFRTQYADYRGILKTTDNATYVEIPLLASYRVKLSDASQFQLNVGPYFAFGVTGKHKVESTFQGQQNYEIDSFDDYDGMKTTDAGIRAGAAVCYSSYYVGVSYERSMKNVSNATNADFRNGCIGITLGYNFNL